MPARPTPDPQSTGPGPAADTRRGFRRPVAVLRILLGLEASTFFIAAVFHYGVSDGSATRSETIIGIVLIGGLVLTWVRPQAFRVTAVAVQGLALLGTFVGLAVILLRANDPPVVGDVLYHTAIALLLIMGIAFAFRTRRTPPA